MYTLKPGQRVRVRGVPGTYVLDKLVMSQAGPRAAVLDGDCCVREVPVHLLRPYRWGRRRRNPKWR